MRGRNRPDGAPRRFERIAFTLDRQAPKVAPHAAPPVPAPESKAPDASAPTREPRDWAFLGLLAFTFVVFLRPQDLVPPLEALHLADVFAVLATVSLLNGRLKRQLPIVPMTPEVMGVLAFACVMLALIPLSIWPGGSFTMLTGLFLKVVLIFVLIAGTVTTPVRLERFVWVIVLTSGYLAFRAVTDYGRGINLIENGRVTGAVGGVFGNPNDLAMNMVAFLPPALLLAARRGGRASGRAVAAAIAVLMLATIVFTKSRSGFLGLGAMLLVVMVQGGKVRRGFGAVVLVSIIAAVPLVPDSFWARIASITDPAKDETGSRESRRTDMREAWMMFVERPLTGVGPGQLTAYNPAWRQERWREAHNVFLQVAADNGIFGVLAFGYLVFRAFAIALSTSRRAARRASKAPPSRSTDDIVLLISTAMTASVTGWFVCAMFASVAYTWTFYYVFGIATAARLAHGQTVRQSHKPRTGTRPLAAA